MAVGTKKTDAALPEETTAVDAVTDKYRVAGELADDVLTQVIALCVPGAKILDLCKQGDELIRQKVETVFTKKENGEKMRKGVAFPTCISVNEIMGNFSPIDESTQPDTLAEGDVAKIDLGVSIGGYAGVVGHTIVVGSGSGLIEGRKADVILAAHTAMEAALRTMKTGSTNEDVTLAIESAYDAFDCRGVHGVLSHAIKRNCIDDPKYIIQNRQLPDEKVEEFTFAPHQAFVLEVMASTGTGKARETTLAPMIYQRDPDNSHPMKSPMTRQFLADVLKSRPHWPFNAREETDSKKRALGTAECVRNFMLQAFPVVTEAPGELVAKFSATILVLPNGIKKTTGLTVDVELLKSEKKLSEKLEALLKEPWGIAKKKKGPKAATNA